MAWDFYTGPVGRMQRMPLVDSSGVATTRARLAALQQSLGGGITRDTLAIKRGWALTWPSLLGADLAFLELLNLYGVCALVDPMENRLPADVASGGSHTRTPVAFTRSGAGTGNGLAWRYAGFGDQAPTVPAQGLLVWTLNQANGFERLDQTTTSPVVAGDPPPEGALLGEGETVQVTVWARWPSSINLALGVLQHGSQFNPRSPTEVLSGYQTGNGAWQRRTLTVPASPGAAALSVRMVAIPSTNTGTVTVELSGFTVDSSPTPNPGWLPGAGPRFVVWDVPSEGYLAGGARSVTVNAQEV